MMMRKIIVGFFFFCTSVLFSHSMEVTLVTNTKQDFPHLIGNSEEIDRSKPGVTVDLLKMVADKVGVDLQFKRMPWKRCFKSLQAGQVDGLFFASYDPKREESGVFPKKNGELDKNKSYGDAPYYFYKLKSSNVTWDGKQLRHCDGKIGVSRGYSIKPFLESMGFSVEESTGPATDFKKLLLNRVGLVAAIEHNADHLLESHKEFNEHIEKIVTPIISKKYFLVFSHQFYNQHREVAEGMWNALEQLRNNHYDRLLKEYLEYFEDTDDTLNSGNSEGIK